MPILKLWRIKFFPPLKIFPGSIFSHFLVFALVKLFPPLKIFPGSIFFALFGFRDGKTFHHIQNISRFNFFISIFLVLIIWAISWNFILNHKIVFQNISLNNFWLKNKNIYLKNDLNEYYYNIIYMDNKVKMFLIKTISQINDDSFKLMDHFGENYFVEKT